MHHVEFGSPTLGKQDVVSKSPFLVLKVHRIFIQFHNVSTFYCKNITYRLRNNIASTPFLSQFFVVHFKLRYSYLGDI